MNHSNKFPEKGRSIQMSKSVLTLLFSNIYQTMLKIISIPRTICCEIISTNWSRSGRLCSWNNPIEWPISWITVPTLPHPLPSEMLFLPPLYPTGLLHLYGYNFHFDENIFYTIRNKQAVGNNVKLRFYILVCPWIRHLWEIVKTIWRKNIHSSKVL